MFNICLCSPCYWSPCNSLSLEGDPLMNTDLLLKLCDMQDKLEKMDRMSDEAQELQKTIQKELEGINHVSE